MKELQNIQICVECAEDYPDHLENSENNNSKTTGEIQRKIFNNKNTPSENKNNIDKGLKNFQLKPKGITHMELFEQMILFWEMHEKRRIAKTETVHITIRVSPS